METPATTEVADDRASHPRGSRLATRDLVAVGTVAALIRVAFSAGRNMFQLVPDEAATFAMARWLSGGTRWNMFVNGTWRPGFATLIAPLFWVTDDQTTIYRLTLAIAAVIGGIGAALLARVGELATDLPRGTLLLSAVLISSMPASLVSSAHAWSEPIFTVAFLATVICLITLWSTGRLRSAFGAIVWGAASYTCHGRGLLLALIATAATVGFLASTRRLWQAAGAAVTAAGLLVASSAYAGWYVDRLWVDAADTNTPVGVIERLGAPLRVADAAVGQIWYLLAATLGVAGVGIVALARTAARGPDHLRSSARIVLVTTLPMVALSIVFMSGRTRADHYVYGRYNEAVIGPVLLAGIAWLRTWDWSWPPRLRRTEWATAGSVVLVWLVAGVTTWSLHSEDVISLGIVWEMVAGVTALNGSTIEIRVLSLTVATIAIAIGAALLASWRRSWIAGAAIILLVSAGVRTHQFLEPGTNRLERAANFQSIDGTVIGDGEPIVLLYVTDDQGPQPGYITQLYYAHALQWYLPGHEFTLTFERPVSPGALVIAPGNAATMQGDATLLWTDDTSGLAVFRLP